MKLTTSVTRLQAFRTCRRRVYLSDILGLRSAPINTLEKEKEAKMSIGTIIHQVLQDTKDSGNIVASEEAIKAVSDAGYDLIKTCEKYLEDFTNRKETVISKEQDYLYEFNGVELYARPDEVVQTENGDLIVIDHKTTVSKGNTFARHNTVTRYQLLDYCTILTLSGTGTANNAEVRVAQVYNNPIVIPRNANGSLRKRVAGATYNDYMHAINLYDLRAGDYTDILEELKAKEQRNSENYKFFFKPVAIEENHRQINRVIQAYKEEFSKPIEHFMDVVGADNASCGRCLFKSLCETGRNFTRDVANNYKDSLFVVKEPDIIRNATK